MNRFLYLISTRGDDELDLLFSLIWELKTTFPQPLCFHPPRASGRKRPAADQAAEDCRSCPNHYHRPGQDHFQGYDSLKFCIQELYINVFLSRLPWRPWLTCSASLVFDRWVVVRSIDIRKCKRLSCHNL